MMLAMTAQAFGIIGGFFTTAGLGAWALVRSTRGDTALSTANNATALWTQTTALIDQLQEENIRHQEMIGVCEKKCVECNATSGLLTAELAALKLDHAKMTAKIDLMLEPRL